MNELYYQIQKTMPSSENSKVVKLTENVEAGNVSN